MSASRFDEIRDKCHFDAIRIFPMRDKFSYGGINIVTVLGKRDHLGKIIIVQYERF